MCTEPAFIKRCRKQLTVSILLGAAEGEEAREGGEDPGGPAGAQGEEAAGRGQDPLQAAPQDGRGGGGGGVLGSSPGIRVDIHYMYSTVPTYTSKYTL